MFRLAAKSTLVSDEVARRATESKTKTDFEKVELMLLRLFYMYCLASALSCYNARFVWQHSLVIFTARLRIMQKQNKRRFEGQIAVFSKKLLRLKTMSDHEHCVSEFYAIAID